MAPVKGTVKAQLRPKAVTCSLLKTTEKLPVKA
jgi:hypothetical protein